MTRQCRAYDDRHHVSCRLGVANDNVFCRTHDILYNSEGLLRYYRHGETGAVHLVDTNRLAHYLWRDSNVFKMDGSDNSRPVLCSDTVFPIAEGVPPYIYPLVGSGDSDLFRGCITRGEWDTLHDSVDYLAHIGERTRCSDLVQLACLHVEDPLGVLLRVCGRNSLLTRGMHERTLESVPDLVTTHDTDRLLESCLYIARCIAEPNTSLLVSVVRSLVSPIRTLATLLVKHQPSLLVVNDLVRRGGVKHSSLSSAILDEIPVINTFRKSVVRSRNYEWVRQACGQLVSQDFEHYVIRATIRDGLHPALARWCTRDIPTLRSLLEVLATIVETRKCGLDGVRGMLSAGIPLAIKQVSDDMSTWESFVHHFAISADDNDRHMDALTLLLDHDSSCVNSRIRFTDWYAEKTPLDLATLYNQVHTVDLLLLKGATVDMYNQTLFEEALKRGRTHIVQKLVEHVVRVEGDPKSKDVTLFFNTVFELAIDEHRASNSFVEWLVLFMVTCGAHKSGIMVTRAVKQTHAHALRMLVIHGWYIGREVYGDMRHVVADAQDEVLRRLVDVHIQSADTANIVSQYASFRQYR